MEKEPYPTFGKIPTAQMEALLHSRGMTPYGITKLFLAPHLEFSEFNTPEQGNNFKIDIEMEQYHHMKKMQSQTYFQVPTMSHYKGNNSKYHNINKKNTI